MQRQQPLSFVAGQGLLDNLLLIRLHCVPLQFMPQDKVASFAALSPTDLLLVTQKSIGTQELLQLHRQLIDNRREEKDERKASMRGISALLLIYSCWPAQHVPYASLRGALSSS